MVPFLVYHYVSGHSGVLKDVADHVNISYKNLIQNPTYPSNRSCLTLGLNVTDFFTTSLSFSKKKLDVLEASPTETFNKVGTRKCSTIHFIRV